MICQNCQRAGTLNDKPGREEEARLWHERCDSPSGSVSINKTVTHRINGCTCQHKLGDYLQRSTDRPMERVK